MDRLLRAAFGLPRRRTAKENRAVETGDADPDELPESVRLFDRKHNLAVTDWYAQSWRGDLSAFTSTMEDIWYQLTVSMSVSRVLLLEVLVEAGIILAFALLLWLLAMAEGPSGHSGFGSKLALSLSSVRLNTDSIFGWKERPASSPAEVAVLVAEGWLHWLLLNVAGAVIVARALLPHRQMTFAHTAIVDTDKELIIRVTLVRQGAVLMQPSIRLQCSDIMGRYQDLSKGTLSEGHTVLPQTCLTLRHVIDESSPLHTCNGGRSNICAVLCSITAIDGVSGAPVHAAVAYVSPSAAAGDPSILPGIETKPKLCWDAKFKDMLDFAKDGTVLVNLDNMSRVVSNRNSACSSTLASATWEAAQTAEQAARKEVMKQATSAKVVPGGAVAEEETETTLEDIV